jgi:hypothetical protein
MPYACPQPSARSNSATSNNQRQVAAVMCAANVQISAASSSSECVGRVLPAEIVPF